MIIEILFAIQGQRGQSHLKVSYSFLLTPSVLSWGTQIRTQTGLLIFKGSVSDRKDSHSDLNSNSDREGLDYSTASVCVPFQICSSILFQCSEIHLRIPTWNLLFRIAVSQFNSIRDQRRKKKAGCMGGNSRRRYSQFHSTIGEGFW